MPHLSPFISRYSTELALTLAVLVGAALVGITSAPLLLCTLVAAGIVVRRVFRAQGLAFALIGAVVLYLVGHIAIASVSWFLMKAGSLPAVEVALGVTMVALAFVSKRLSPRPALQDERERDGSTAWWSLGAASAIVAIIALPPIILGRSIYRMAILSYNIGENIDDVNHANWIGGHVRLAAVNTSQGLADGLITSTGGYTFSWHAAMASLMRAVIGIDDQGSYAALAMYVVLKLLTFGLLAACTTLAVGIVIRRGLPRLGWYVGPLAAATTLSVFGWILISFYQVGFFSFAPALMAGPVAVALVALRRFSRPAELAVVSIVAGALASPWLLVVPALLLGVLIYSLGTAGKKALMVLALSLRHFWYCYALVVVIATAQYLAIARDKSSGENILMNPGGLPTLDVLPLCLAILGAFVGLAAMAESARLRNVVAMNAGLLVSLALLALGVGVQQLIQIHDVRYYFHKVVWVAGYQMFLCAAVGICLALGRSSIHSRGLMVGLAGLISIGTFQIVDPSTARYAAGARAYRAVVTTALKHYQPFRRDATSFVYWPGSARTSDLLTAIVRLNEAETRCASEGRYHVARDQPLEQLVATMPDACKSVRVKVFVPREELARFQAAKVPLPPNVTLVRWER